MGTPAQVVDHERMEFDMSDAAGIRRVICGVLVPLVCAVMVSSCGRVAESSDRVADPLERVFSTARLVEVSVEMDPDDLYAMRREGRTFATLAEGCGETQVPYVYTDFMSSATVDGERLERVGVRKKGFIGSLSVSRPSIKLRFNQYVQRQHLSGLRRVTLNNNRQDASNILQCLAYRIFSDAGVPTPACGFAHVTLNGEDLGVYTSLETYDRQFLARHFPSDEGKLYEGQLSDFRASWIESFENKLQDTFDDRNELFELTRALRADDEDLLELLEPLLDMDAYLSFWATESLIGHWDGYNGNQNNFFLYLEPTTRKFYFIPWGTDGSFTDSPFLTRPAPVSVTAFGMLPYRLYGLPQIRTRYFERLRELLDTVWDEDAILAEIDRYAAVLSPHADETVLDAARTYVRERRGLIEAELSLGEPVWDFPLNPAERCFEVQPEVRASFSTTWGSASAANPFGQGEADLHVIIDGEEQTFTALTSVAGISTDFFNQPSVNILGLREDGSMVALVLVFEEFGFTPGSPEFHGVATFGAVTELVNGVPQLGGLVSGGTLHLEAASTEEGAPVIGEVTSPWFWR
jgi:spore coat protein CotH